VRFRFQRCGGNGGGCGWSRFSVTLQNNRWKRIAKARDELYDWPTVLLSLISAIVASTVALYLVMERAAARHLKIARLIESTMAW
jgi:hypothetical protein